MSPADAKYFAEVRNLSYTLHPKLLNLTPGSDTESGLSVAVFPPNIEQEVESIYSRIYAGDISIDQALDMLRESKSATSLHDKEIFACMLHSLFDEYKFFHQYPARELAMTGYMFGSIIQLRLLENVPLGIAIRYVLEAIRSPPDSNLFAFGIEALMRFESRLVEWAPLCSTLLRIPHLHTARPDVAESVRRALVRAENAANGEGGDDLADGGIQFPELDPAPLTFTAIQADDMSSDPIAEPSPEDSEKILFIVNNLAPTNFQAKLDEMKERFKEGFSRWFANYLVDQRVSTEPNNHSIYLRFLDGLESHRLQKHVLNETYFKSATLLNTEQKPGQPQSVAEKTALKNLGSWLGSITLARNQAIKHRNLAFKELLMEGYDGNRLTKAMPFLCKILEQSAKSVVFVPPNPWLIGVLDLLAELYQFADLRLNLKFEIEVLCKALHVDLDKLEPATVLRDRAAIIDNGPQFPEFAPGMESLPIGPYDVSVPMDGGQPAQMLQLSSTSPSHSQPLTSHIEAIIADISNHIVINPQLVSLTVNPGFKRVIQLAVERAVRDVRFCLC
jgi:CCR4-NOT transcription complex subunit 1